MSSKLSAEAKPWTPSFGAPAAVAPAAAPLGPAAPASVGTTATAAAASAPSGPIPITSSSSTVNGSGAPSAMATTSNHVNGHAPAHAGTNGHHAHAATRSAGAVAGAPAGMVDGIGGGVPPAAAASPFRGGQAHAFDAVQSEWFRYTVALPSARTVSTEAATGTSLYALSASRSLIPGRGRDNASFDAFIKKTFENVANRSYTQAMMQSEVLGGAPWLPGNVSTGSLLPLGSPTTSGTSEGSGVGLTGAAAAVAAAQQQQYPAGGRLSAAALPSQSSTGFLLTRRLVNPSTTEYMADLSALDGLLLSVDAVMQPDGDVNGTLAEAWAYLMQHISGNQTVEAAGYAMLEAPVLAQGGAGGCSFFHYFYLVLSPNSTVTVDTLTNSMAYVRKVTPVRRVLSFILGPRLPLAVDLRFSVEGDDIKETTPAAPAAGSEEAKEGSSHAPCIFIDYDATNGDGTMRNVQAALRAVEAAIGPASQKESASGDSSTSSEWRYTYTQTFVIRDVTKPIIATAAAVASSPGPAAAAAASTTATSAAVVAARTTATTSLYHKIAAPYILPANDAVVELALGLSLLGGGFVSVSKTPAVDTKASTGLRSLTSLLLPEAAAAATSSSALAGRPLVVPCARSMLAVPFSAIPSVFTSGFMLPVGGPLLYADIRAKLVAMWQPVLTTEARTLALSTDKAKAIAHVFATVPYVARRTAVGTKILLCIDEQGRHIICDPRTNSITVIVSCWSNRMASVDNSVFSATLTPTFRGVGQFRIIVDDVYRFNGQSLLMKPFRDRWAHLEGSLIDSEGTWNYPSPYGPVVLHAAYVSIHDISPRLLDASSRAAGRPASAPIMHEQGPPPSATEGLEPVDHATLGLTFVPTMSPVMEDDDGAILGSSAATPAPGGKSPAAAAPSTSTAVRDIDDPTVREALHLVPLWSWVPPEAHRVEFTVMRIAPHAKGEVKVFLGVPEGTEAPETPPAQSTPITPTAPVAATAAAPSVPPVGSDNDLLPEPLALAGGLVKKVGEPVLEVHQRRFWIASTAAAPQGTVPNSVPPAPFYDEFVVVPEVLVAAGYISSGAVIECVARRSATGDARWWEYCRTMPASAANHVVSRLHSHHYASWAATCPFLKDTDLDWLAKAYTFKCAKCNSVDAQGNRDVRSQQFWCRACTGDSGYGDCVQCCQSFVPGSVCLTSGKFYCERCWQRFSMVDSQLVPVGAPPPPIGATFEIQVVTRVGALLVDSIAEKFPLHDVLDVCVPDTSIAHKFMMAPIDHYTGITTSETLIGSIHELRASCFKNSPTTWDLFRSEFAPSAASFWDAITPRHRKQFNAVFAFHRLHRVFSNKDTALDFFHYVFRALVPGGVFGALFFCPSAFFQRGAPYVNDFFALRWNVQQYEQQHRLSCSTAASGTPTGAAPTTVPVTPEAGGAAATGTAASTTPGTPAFPRVDSATDGVASSAASTPLVPSGRAWRPRSLVSVSSMADAGSVANSPSAPAQDKETDMTLPPLGMTYQLTFLESMGSASESSQMMMAHTPATPASPTPSSVFSDSGRPFTTNDTTRTESMIPLEVLCALAEQAGLELQEDLCAKADDMLAGDGKFTRVLSQDEKEFFGAYKAVVFKKPARRPHGTTSTAAAPTPTIQSPL